MPAAPLIARSVRSAKDWARHFEAELPDYVVTLLKDGVPLPFEEAKR